jgi:predicted nicotinamide N-methyase
LGATVTLADYARPAVLFAAANVWPWRTTAAARVVDWHHDRLGERFDVILGADIVYEQRNWESLQHFFWEHLADGGELILTEPGRETGETFQAFLKQRGWELQTSVLKILDNQRPLRLLLAKLK